MSMKLAFAGLRHGHITALYALADQLEEVEIVAVCEEDEETRNQFNEGDTIKVTHSDLDTMLNEVECDAVAVGDYYAKRGAVAIRALECGKHVVSDKPLCTELDELDRIEQLSQERNLKIGCMFDIRSAPQFIGVKNLIQSGTIGEIHAIHFNGQHPLSLGVRPNWYFEPGKHGGTINDIGVHAFDFIPWITGLDFETVNAARCWNAFAGDYPFFKDAAQMMLTMNNGCGVLGDVSYFLPDSTGYSLPFYWRTTFFGRKGIIETSSTAKQISAAINGQKEMTFEELPEPDPGYYFKAFQDDINGISSPEMLNTESVLRTSRTVLTVQKAGDENLCNIKL